jgi:hypothetical protein
VFYYRQHFADDCEIEAQIPKRDGHELALSIRMGSQSASAQFDYVSLIKFIRALGSLAEEIAARA